MADLDGDKQPEVFVENLIIGDTGYFKKPAVTGSWTIYRRENEEWNVSRWLHFCAATKPDGDGWRPSVSNRPVDLLWIDGKAVNFFDDDCYRENSDEFPQTSADKGMAMARKLRDVELIKDSADIPDSLGIALSKRSVRQIGDGYPPTNGDSEERPSFAGLPPCFVSASPRSCAAFVHDFDKDGSQDVVIIDRKQRDGTKSWRLVTLLSATNGVWSVVANHAVCAAPGEDLQKVRFEAKPATFLPVNFAGRLYIPAEDTDTCTIHYPIM